MLFISDLLDIQTQTQPSELEKTHNYIIIKELVN